jgi:hypothetical protein
MLLRIVIGVSAMRNSLLPSEFKLFVTAASLAVAIVIVVAVTPAHEDDGSGWARGRRNLLRRALYTSKDTLRKHAKTMLIVYLAIFNILMWTFL